VAVEVADENTVASAWLFGSPLIDPRGHRVGRRCVMRSLFCIAKGFREHQELFIDR
jgi:hypothetical protein